MCKRKPSRYVGIYAKNTLSLPQLFDILPLTQEQETCYTDNSQVIIRPLFGLKILDLKVHFCIDQYLSVFGRNMLQLLYDDSAVTDNCVTTDCCCN